MHPSDRHQAWGHVRGIERLSLCDWPGRACAVLFTGGCNLRCPTCHNAEMAWAPGRLPALDRDEVLGLLSRRARWLDGITVTGGEPTLVPGLAALLADLADLGLPVKLDTNGMRPAVVRSLLGAGLVQTFAVDVKGPYHKYPELTGGGVDAATARAGLEAIFRMAAQAPGAFYFRTTRVPLLDAGDMDTIRGLLPAGFTLVEQKYVAPQRRTDAQTDSQARQLPGDLVPGPHCPSHIQGPQGQRHQGSHSLQAAGA
ncbi:anaerobic ribonucleoside-triphosphate reductase activating protein [Desulfocurvus sp.]|jgi:pyruvate formate lyase activating enzyme|uniref:anaerobic ribonucleoside-triphosphate reductase activating protein n=1 Tax=Desulfocurvus sp. TaxID=2871698 RepID=UPI0025BA04D3|nr:anaerobic ribonucleoside-triphosphate reductase activating protein [Desulfocurvus sp.]MCK9239509.1 anaerobic ribonucleoside-triphosphate reductase activating protein [Desulfocurvus sp.]